MPCYLNEKNIVPELAGFKSVLIVPCRFCPAATLSVKKNAPYIELFHSFLKTTSYENYIKSLKSSLEKRGIRTGIFESKLIHQFVMCMWTSFKRKKLLKRARKYEALIVLGCEAAVETVRFSVKSASCVVFQGMETEGIMSILPKFYLPGNITLELESITPLIYHEEKSKISEHLVTV